MIGGGNIRTGVVEELYCDTPADIADLEQYARDHDLKQGSTALIISTGEVYAMKSDYTWNQI